MAASRNLVKFAQVPGIVLGGVFAIAIAAQLFVVAPAINSEHQQQVRASQSASLQQQINLKTAFIQTQLATIANSVHLAQVVSNSDRAVQSTEEAALRDLIPGAIRVRIFGIREAQVERDAIPPFSFTSLDLVNRSELGEVVQPEAIKSAGSWTISIATPIRIPGDSEVLGTLFVYLDMTVLTSGLEFDGRLALMQQVGTSPAIEIYSAGEGSGEGLELPLDNPNWKIRYTPGAGTKASIVNTALAMVPLILILLAGLVAIYLALQRLLNILDRDLSHLDHQMASVYSGMFEPSDRYQIDGFANVDGSLARLTRSPGDTIAPGSQTPAVAPVKVGAKPADPEPDAELVDIEMLDDESFEDALEKLESGASEEAPVAEEVDVSGIFRAYDIRGIVDETLTPELIHDIGLAIGTEAEQAGEQTLMVGADGRVSSPDVLDALINGLLASGRDVISIGLVPTPVLYYATHNSETESGVMVTGSHNPPEYNGFKVVIGGRTLVDEDIKRLYQRIQDRDFTSGEGQLTEIDIRDDYVDAIVDDVVIAQPLKVVVDCGNGIAGELLPELLTSLGCDVIPLYCEVDGTFPNHPPDPTIAANLASLIEEVQASAADLGIALDGDGDRVVAVTADGEMVLPDRLLMLFVKDVVSRNPGSDVVYDIKCTRYLNQVISGFGGRPVLSRSGHSFMKAKMAETNAILGGEMSGHVCFAERWFGFDDGLYAAARLLEIVGSQNESLAELLAEFPEGVSTPELFVAVDDAAKFGIVETLIRNCQFEDATTTTIDGLRIDFADGWGLVRASNTNPALTLRFEADDDEALQRIQGLIRDALQAIDENLNF